MNFDITAGGFENGLFMQYEHMPTLPLLFTSGWNEHWSVSLQGNYDCQHVSWGYSTISADVDSLTSRAAANNLN